jgi:hypothetical protein
LQPCLDLQVVLQVPLAAVVLLQGDVLPLRLDVCQLLLPLLLLLATGHTQVALLPALVLLQLAAVVVLPLLLAAVVVLPLLLAAVVVLPLLLAAVVVLPLQLAAVVVLLFLLSVPLIERSRAEPYAPRGVLLLLSVPLLEQALRQHPLDLACILFHCRELSL